MLFEGKLENGLVMRNVRSEEDIFKFTEITNKYNNVSEGATCNILLREHKGILIKTAMLEMVLSHPDYRKLGLVKELINYFLAEVDRRGYQISIITGIPYYYRQYGYTYGLDLGTTES